MAGRREEKESRRKKRKEETRSRLQRGLRQKVIGFIENARTCSRTRREFGSRRELKLSHPALSLFISIPLYSLLSLSLLPPAEGDWSINSVKMDRMPGSERHSAAPRVACH
jgi:hypothetical protein